MPRSIKCRRVCSEPRNRVFIPKSKGGSLIRLNVDELEALRLCDLEGLEQDIAAERMGVSRGTFQRILYSARKSIAGALVYGNGIIIEGGNYEVAGGSCECEKDCIHCIFKKDNLKEM